MSLAEGVQAQVAYKKYASGAITANALAVSSSDLGASGAQVLRRVSSSLKLQKDIYKSNEIRADRQTADFRHGFGRVTGSLSGEWSPGTYFDFIEAACRGTRASAVALTESDLTSAAFDNGASTVTFGGGDPVALGLRVGQILRFTNLATAGNNSRNFVITGFSGGSNRTVGIYPAPTTETADTAFNVTTVGKSVFVPSSGFVSRKFGFEHYFSDLDIAHLFTECRVGGFTLQLPSTGMSTIDVPVMGRVQENYSASGAPFFTSPTVAGATGILAAVNGLLMVGGVAVGVVTGMNMQMNLNPSAQAVVGQNYPPEIFLDTADVSGQITAMLQDNTLIDDFLNESEVSILAFLTSSSDAASAASTIFLPRVKFGDAPVAVQGGGAQIITLPFQALKYAGASPGVENTTFQMCDTEAA